MIRKIILLKALLDRQRKLFLRQVRGEAILSVEDYLDYLICLSQLAANLSTTETLDRNVRRGFLDLLRPTFVTSLRVALLVLRQENWLSLTTKGVYTSRPAACVGRWPRRKAVDRD
jgi:hypothetical protein